MLGNIAGCSCCFYGAVDICTNRTEGMGDTVLGAGFAISLGMHMQTSVCARAHRILSPKVQPHVCLPISRLPIITRSHVDAATKHNSLSSLVRRASGVLSGLAPISRRQPITDRHVETRMRFVAGRCDNSARAAW